MNLDFLAKLLLQHDESPLVGSQDLHLHLIYAAEEGRVKCAGCPKGPGVAVALDQRLVIAQQQSQAAGVAASSQGSIASLEFANVLKAPETVASLAWLASPDQPADDCLLVGTSTGFLQVHALTGAMLHRQDLHEGPLNCISVRMGGMGIDPGDLSEDITVCAPDAVMRLTLLDIRAVVRWQKGAQGRGWWGAAPAAPTLSLAKWQLPRGTGPRSFAMSLGAAPPSLYSLLTGREQGEKSQIFTAGSGPPLATLEAGRCFTLSAFQCCGAQSDESNSGGLFSLISRAREALPIGLPSRPSVLGGRSKGKEERAKIRAGPASLAASVWDEKRAVTRVSMSPCGTLAACCDNLGRVLLVDTAATLVIRMLKGYRDAQVAWLVGPAGLQQRRRHCNPNRQQAQEQQHQQQELQPEEDGEEEVQSVRRGEEDLGLHGGQGRAEQAQQGAGREDAASAAAALVGSSREDWEARWSDSDESVPAAESGAPEHEQQGAQQEEAGRQSPAHPAAGEAVSRGDDMGSAQAPDSIAGEVSLPTAAQAVPPEYDPTGPGFELQHQQPHAAEQAAVHAAGMQTKDPSAASLAGFNKAGSSFSALPDLDEPAQLATPQPVQPPDDSAPPAEGLGPLLGAAGQHGPAQVGAGVQEQAEQRQEPQHEAGIELPQSPSDHQQEEARQQLYVVVYAPRRAVVELWQPHSGRRAAAVRYQSQHAMLLQQPIRPPQQSGLKRTRTGAAEPSATHGAAGEILEGIGGGAVLATNSVWMLDLESLQLLDLGKLLLDS